MDKATPATASTYFFRGSSWADTGGPPSGAPGADRRPIPRITDKGIAWLLNIVDECQIYFNK